MKLSALNTAIRKTEGSVKLLFQTPVGPIQVGLVKSELLNGLAALHQGLKAAETGLKISDDGFLTRDVENDPRTGEVGFAETAAVRETVHAAARQAAPKPDPVDNMDDDANDLLGGDLLNGLTTLHEPAPAVSDIDDLLG
jgi:hypothetical protein